MIALRFNTTEFQERLPRIIAAARRPRAVLAAMGREGTNLLKRHFREKDKTEVNKLAPGRREHLWLKISRGVQMPVVSDTFVDIDINHPVIAQKVFGGPIIAKRVRNLAIPRSEDAYGRSPKTFEAETGLKLFVLKTPGNALLAAARGQEITVEYLLTPRVDQDRDEDALPDEKTFTTALLRRAETVQQRQLNGSN